MRQDGPVTLHRCRPDALRLNLAGSISAFLEGGHAVISDVANGLRKCPRIDPKSALLKHEGPAIARKPSWIMVPVKRVELRR